MAKLKKLTIQQAFQGAEPRPPHDADRSDKKNYAERLSRQLARVFADELRSSFTGILPDPNGLGQESKARTSKGYKKLDVNYSTLQLGLALGLSIKTINYVDGKSKRYTKNYSRNENELRAEAMDYHTRQPWAVLVAIVFLPMASCDDGGGKTDKGASSFGSAVRFFRNISGREAVDGPADKFEAVYVALYDSQANVFRFFDVGERPPKHRRPADSETFSLSQVIDRICDLYDRRNNPPFVWADDSAIETEPLELEDEAEDESEV